jgi:glycosyltransferase involved in cell wall biosynthesis
VDLLIQAYAETRSSKAAANQASPCLVVAGPGLETPFGNEMRDLATKSCPPGSVFFPGMLTGDAKWGALYFSEAFALISHQENFGIAVAESLACGRPVLISNKVNIWREIDEDNAGLAADDNPAGARQLFQSWFMLSTEEKAAKERAARSTYEKRFCSRVAAQNLLTTIEELAMRSRVRSPH